MGIGASVVLIAFGAILNFATEFDVYGLDIQAIGTILMIVGVIGLVVTLTIFAPRRRSAPSWQDHRYPPPNHPPYQAAPPPHDPYRPAQRPPHPHDPYR